MSPGHMIFDELLNIVNVSLVKFSIFRIYHVYVCACVCATPSHVFEDETVLMGVDTSYFLTSR
jgi:hypothetical protein